jgi:hypothetical protein
MGWAQLYLVLDFPGQVDKMTRIIIEDRLKFRTVIRRVSGEFLRNSRFVICQ